MLKTNIGTYIIDSIRNTLLNITFSEIILVQISTTCVDLQFNLIILPICDINKSKLKIKIHLVSH